MSSNTPRLGAAYILANQSQKEVTHNAALNLLDGLVQCAVEDKDLTVPPASPADGGLWIVPSGASGAWAGQADKLAQWIGGGWQFIVPPDGSRAWVKDEAIDARFDGGVWHFGELRGTELRINGSRVVGAQQAAIADASGGGTIDSEARAALNALLGACRAHGLIA